ncbi:hypothetical protein ABH939_005792 [Rhodococcus sp. 27YEA6]
MSEVMQARGHLASDESTADNEHQSSVGPFTSNADAVIPRPQYVHACKIRQSPQATWPKSGRDDAVVVADRRTDPHCDRSRLDIQRTRRFRDEGRAIVDDELLVSGQNQFAVETRRSTVLCGAKAPRPAPTMTILLGPSSLSSSWLPRQKPQEQRFDVREQFVSVVQASGDPGLAPLDAVDGDRHRQRPPDRRDLAVVHFQECGP